MAGMVETSQSSLAEQVTDQVVLVQPLHDQHDGTFLLVVQPGGDRVVVAAVGLAPLALGEGRLRLLRIVDDDEIGTSPQDRAVQAAGIAAAVQRRDDLATPARLI